MAIFGNYYNIVEKFDEYFPLEVKKYFEEILNNQELKRDYILNMEIDKVNKINIKYNTFALEQKYITKSRNNCFYESHKKYIDLQLILSGSEVIEVCNKENLSFLKYDEEKDFMFYELPEEKYSNIKLYPEDILILFPEDAHLGCKKNEVNQIITKTVIKLPYN